VGTALAARHPSSPPPNVDTLCLPPPLTLIFSGIINNNFHFTLGEVHGKVEWCWEHKTPINVFLLRVTFPLSVTITKNETDETLPSPKVPPLRGHLNPI
jgi:hypothetical protein